MLRIPWTALTIGGPSFYKLPLIVAHNPLHMKFRSWKIILTTRPTWAYGIDSLCRHKIDDRVFKLHLHMDAHNMKSKFKQNLTSLELANNALKPCILSL